MSKDKTKVVILHNKINENASKDKDFDTIVQVEDISKVLSNLGYEPVPVPFSIDISNITATLQDIKPNFVFNIVEFVDGKEQLAHLAPSILDYLKIPYTGCPTEGMFLATNKIIAKRMLRSYDIPTPDWITLGDTDRIESMTDKPLIIKSIWGHGSTALDENSVLILKDKSQIQKELRARFKSFDDYFFAENFIDGREFTVSILAKNGRPEVLPPAEMKFLNYTDDKLKIIGFKAKWDENSFEYNNTERTFEISKEDKPLISKIRKIALRCWNIFKLNGYARIDIRLDDKGVPNVLDVNANPYISINPDNSAFIKSAEHAGISIEDVIKRIISHLVYFRRRHYLI